ncbi:MAG: polysaccharide deacetylase family protein [Peptoniphilus sp.]|uniref:polysaccharide deacetylase family protein n=1 Tax=Peptoniphilus sp. TaxID=1971214 RepID=UPI002A7595B5|nr:polysaccharide deacetylase family protein [Peptoniphilus sp.]MDY2987543.1 polysaccharide deacetylase family protein [Peptoniphilus sp.]
MKKSIFLILIVLGFGLIYWFRIRTVGNGTLPVITYHGISDENPTNSEYVISNAKFEETIKALKEANFTFLTIYDLDKLVSGEMKLPKNPIFITFDDGYRNNYENAYPILKKYGAKASLFMVGSQLERPDFLTRPQIIEMAESGVFAFGSHTYSLDGTFLDGANKGKTFLSSKLEGETDAEFYAKIKNDLVWNNDVVYNMSSTFPNAIAYPGAMVNEIAKKAVVDAGLKYGFVGANKFATKLSKLDPDNPETLLEIHRFHVSPSTNVKNLVRFLQSNN